MFLVNYRGDIKEIKSFKEFPRSEYVFTKKKDAEKFADLLLDQNIAVHEKNLNRLKEKRNKH